MDEELTPSFHGELCRHNGENPDYEIACEECDYYLLCFSIFSIFINKSTCRGVSCGTKLIA